MELSNRIPGIVSLRVDGEYLFLRISDDNIHGNFKLISGGKESVFRKFEAETRPISVLDVHNVVERFNSTKPISGSGAAIFMSVNGLPEWACSDADTIQIEFQSRDIPVAIDLPSGLSVCQTGGPWQFFAYLACHRARAQLILRLKDRKTSAVQSFRIPFEASVSGGREISKYQKVSLQIPGDIIESDIAISIEYAGDLDSESHHAPFIFLHTIGVEPVRSWNNVPCRENSMLAEGNWLFAPCFYSSGMCVPMAVSNGEIFGLIMTPEMALTSHYFDHEYYKNKNYDIDFDKFDPFCHYSLIGWEQFRNPSAEFSVREYLARHRDVEVLGIDPLAHYALIGRAEERSLGTFEEKLCEIWREDDGEIPAINQPIVYKRCQDFLVPMEMMESRKLAVFVVPEHNAMSGGIYSMFSIADHARRNKSYHGYDVVTMTRPNKDGLTYIRNGAFRNCETILRFDQLSLFRNVSDLQLHIPEYATVDFVQSVSSIGLNYLKARDMVHINILNQNINLMPKPHLFRDLRRIADTIGQSVSHHAFFRQEEANFYDLPTLLLPAYTDLSAYPKLSVEQKQKIIIYSDDECSYKSAVLNKLASLHDYRLIKIKDMSFDKYMELASSCMFSVSFGEGFDGYVSQPIYQGGIGFAAYNDEFFPSRDFLRYENFFSDASEMIEKIVPTIRMLEFDQKRYKDLNLQLLGEWEALYQYDDYVARVVKLIKKEYEIYPEKIDGYRKNIRGCFGGL